MEPLHATTSDPTLPDKSPEPSGTRPKPFGDGDGSSRKRRRTSAPATPSSGLSSSGSPFVSAAPMESSKASPTVASSATPNAGDCQIKDSVEQPDLLPEQGLTLVESSQASQPRRPRPVVAHSNHLPGPADDAHRLRKSSLEEVFQQFPVYPAFPTPMVVLTTLRQGLIDKASTSNAASGIIRDISAWIRTFLSTANPLLRESRRVPNRDQNRVLMVLRSLYQDLSKDETPAASEELEASLRDFLSLTADLAAYFTLLDNHRIDLWKAGKNHANVERIPLLFSIPYLKIFHNLVARDRGPGLGPLTRSWEPGDQPADLLGRLGRLLGGSARCLKGLAMGIAQIVEEFPKTADNISVIVAVLAERLGFICRLMRSGGQRDLLPLQQELCAGHELWQSLSSCLVSLTDEQGTLLNSEGTSRAIRGLDDMLQCCLQGDHAEAEHAKREHRQDHPSIDPRCTGEALAWEWKLNLWSGLIQQGQMQLRLMAADDLCAGLVQLFKRLNSAPSREDAALLRHVASYLVGLGLMDYILSPSCHIEITIRCGNVLGFVVATRQFSQEDGRRLWQRMADAQNLTFAEALTHTIKPILNLFDYAGLSDICANFLNLPLEAVTPPLRTLWAGVHAALCARAKITRRPIGRLHFSVCLRMLRGSSVLTSGSQVTDREMHHAANRQLGDLFAHGLDGESCQHILQDCIRDLAAKSPTTLGSLWCLHQAIQSEVAAGMMRDLVHQHDLARLLKEELEHAVRVAQEAGAPAVISGDANLPRRQLVSVLIRSHPEAITNDLGASLWDLLVGELSTCPEDRQAGWQMILDIASQDREIRNSYLDMCTSRHLSRLPPSCFCQGMLEMVQKQAMDLVGGGKDDEKHDTPQTDGPDGTDAPETTNGDPNTSRGDNQNERALDDEAFEKHSVIENMWRIVLEADDASLAEKAIDVLAKGIYLESSSMSSYGGPRARAVHASLIVKCLQQVTSAADQIRAATVDGEILVQGRIFDRTLQFLHRFVEAHRSNERFSSPDLRSYRSRQPCRIEGPLAGLRYQCIGGTGIASPVKPLRIGIFNTGISLLLKLRQASGFDDCTFSFNGGPLQLSEVQMRQSLGDLNLDQGLIVVQQEERRSSSPVGRIKPGSSFIEIEILSYFDQLWRYMGADDQIAKKVYDLLKQLPAHWRIMDLFESPATQCSDVFIPGQPLRTLYAIHALAELLEASRLGESEGIIGFLYQGFSTSSYDTVSRSVSWLVEQAISDLNLVPGTMTQLQEDVLESLLQMFMQLVLKESHRYISIREDLPTPFRLISVMLVAIDMPGEKGILLLTNTLSTFLRLALNNATFWEQLYNHPQFRLLLGRLVLFDKREAVRSKSMTLLSFAISLDIKEQIEALENHEVKPALSRKSLTTCVWTAMLSFLGRSVEFHRQCSEFFCFLEGVSFSIAEHFQMDVRDYRALANKTTKLLLHHTSTEEIDDRETFDLVADGLISIMLLCTKIAESFHPHHRPDPQLAETLFWRFLFPRCETEGNAPAATAPKILFNSQTRQDLCDLILGLVRHDKERFHSLLVDLGSLVPYPTLEIGEEMGPHDHPFNFSREDAVRSPTRYVGLRNLQNTCYINSFLTQLFMNTQFRRFIMSMQFAGPTGSQELLRETQNIFGSMQASRRRYLDTAPFVRSIMSYDNEPINTQVQMDVQEFASLLFSQWEYQCPTFHDKSRLKSFYNGDLIQQIKSTQCAHASERREAFAAIQCDIKGKMSLEESLHAYVDGVLLEGENRWSCSECNDHRDAIKRTCFKTIPDHLIFHLKRFEYHVATQERSKINDYFSFPLTINMQPFTIEHLSNSQTGDVEDMFELVGILVHSGTAESGHYHSYIKERPSSSPRPQWMEFNDENVSTWDPELMEAITFGGPDELAMPDANGNSPQKNHSAYMLFYQRVSSIREEAAAMNLSNAAGPVQVNIPESMKTQIANESLTLSRRHCLFDPTHAVFVKDCLIHALGLLDDDPDSSDEQTRLGQSRSTSDEAMKMALSYLDQVISRTADVRDFEALSRLIKKTVMERADIALAVYRFFRHQPSAFQTMLQLHGNPDIQASTRQLFYLALMKLSRSLPGLYGLTRVPTRLGNPGAELTNGNDEQGADTSKEHEETILEGAMVIFDRLWQLCRRHPMNAWQQVFGMLLDFATLGDREVSHLLAHDYLSRTIGVVIGVHQPLPDQDSLGGCGECEGMIGATDVRRGPTYKPHLMLIDHLMQYLNPAIEPQSISECPSERVSTNRAPFAWSAGEVQAISESPDDHHLSSLFVEELLRLEQVSRIATTIVSRLVSTGEAMETRVTNVVLQNLRGPETQHPMDPFFAAGARCIETTQSIERAMSIVKHVNDQAPYLQHTEGAAFLDFFATALRPRREDGEMAQAIRQASLSTVPTWAPYLVTYTDGYLREWALQLLSQELFSLLRSEDERPPTDLPMLDAEKLVLSLGQACLQFLRQAFIRHSVSIRRGPAEAILSVIENCFTREPSGELWEHHRRGLVQYYEIMDPIEALTVDDLGGKEEEADDGSDWDGSCGSSVRS